VIGALILGFLAGAIARLLMPDVFSGLQGWRSWALSTILGLCGAALGWVIFTKWIGIGDDDVFDLGGIVSAIIGTMIILAIASFVLKRSGHAERIESGSRTAAVEPGAEPPRRADREQRRGGRGRRDR
jgi:uncharacterized membrane protein YeaQ/YmgE (transglycosylase-associated protein family)